MGMNTGTNPIVYPLFKLMSAYLYYIKAGIHYTYPPDFPLIYSLEKLMLDAKDQSQSADLSWLIL